MEKGTLRQSPDLDINLTRRKRLLQPASTVHAQVYAQDPQSLNELIYLCKCAGTRPNQRLLAEPKLGRLVLGIGRCRMSFDDASEGSALDEDQHEG